LIYPEIILINSGENDEVIKAAKLPRIIKNNTIGFDLPENVEKPETERIIKKNKRGSQ
jgi:hypothetical protein